MLLENTSNLKALGCDADVVQGFREAGYGHVATAVLDAADYGVPQRRTRLFVVGFRRDADLREFHWPAPTHGRPGTPGVRPWVTVREALHLGGHEFRRGGKVMQVSWFQGARRIDVDKPATAVTTRNNADWIDPVRGRRWRLGLDELALLQGFPPEFQFVGRTLEDRHRQMGNALPPQVGMALGRALQRVLG